MRVVGLVFMVTLAVSVGLSAIVIGSILSTALLIGPPASALKVVDRFWRGAAIAAALGVGATWAGIVVAYDSYDWIPSHRALPVSFCVVACVVGGVRPSSVRSIDVVAVARQWRPRTRRTT